VASLGYSCETVPVQVRRFPESAVHEGEINRAALETRTVICDSPVMNSELLKRITIEAGKCGGRPGRRSNRIRVMGLLPWLSAGASFAAARQPDHLLRQTA
jgi:hypothetical protein